jgi:hypothetical protein
MRERERERETERQRERERVLIRTNSFSAQTGELNAAKNEIDSVRKFHLSQSKHLTSQYIVAVHSVEKEETAHVELTPLKTFD